MANKKTKTLVELARSKNLAKFRKTVKEVLLGKAAKRLNEKEQEMSTKIFKDAKPPLARGPIGSPHFIGSSGIFNSPVYEKIMSNKRGEKTMEKIDFIKKPTLEEYFESDGEARNFAASIMKL